MNTMLNTAQIAIGYILNTRLIRNTTGDCFLSVSGITNPLIRKNKETPNEPPI